MNIKIKYYFGKSASLNHKFSSMSEFEQWLSSLGNAKTITINGNNFIEDGYVNIDLFNNRKELLGGLK